jgi:hypothetical protein
MSAAADAGGSASDSDPAATAAVARVLAVRRDAVKAAGLIRLRRAVELFERALSAAEGAMPRDSLAIAWLLVDVVAARLAAATELRAALAATRPKDLEAAAFRADETALVASRRCLALLARRWRAGTLLATTPAEAAFFAGVELRDADPEAPVAGAAGANLLFAAAAEALTAWPPDSGTTEEFHYGLGAALETALALWRSGALRTRAWVHARDPLRTLLTGDDGARVLRSLCTPCGVDAEGQAELRLLAQWLTQGVAAPSDEAQRAQFAIGLRTMVACAAADVARHGLRCCALPSCGATEPHPKAHKICGRCRGAAYCCAAHSAQDWRRHKREDSCAPRPDAQ